MQQHSFSAERNTEIVKYNIRLEKDFNIYGFLGKDISTQKYNHAIAVARFDQAPEF